MSFAVTPTVGPPGPIPSNNNSATIVNQSQVFLVGFGSGQPVGWLLYTMRDGIYFVPNISVTFGTGVAATFGSPGWYSLGTSTMNNAQLANAITGILNNISQSIGSAPAAALLLAMKATNVKFTNTTCNTKPLNG